MSWRLSGQRFIIDSYILGNVVFDRVVYKGQKVMRMMPLPSMPCLCWGTTMLCPAA